MTNLQVEVVEVVCTLTINDLAEQNAYPDALTWLQDNNYPDLVTAWGECERADWMLDLLGRLTNDRRLLVQIACALVRRTSVSDGRTVWDLLTNEQSRRAVEMAELWVAGKVTYEDMRDAAVAARPPAPDTASFATDAAYSTAHATYADNKSYVKFFTAYATDNTYDVIAAARAAAISAAYATDNTYDAVSAMQADIVREYVILITEENPHG